MLNRLPSPSQILHPPKKTHQCFAVSPSGVIAISRGSLCTIFVDTEFSFSAFCTISRFTAPITHLSWCRGCTPAGETPLHLCLADCEGHAAVLNPLTGDEISTFSLSQGTVTAIEWDSYSASSLYVATSDCRLIFANVAHHAAEITWARVFDVPIAFIRVSPFDCHRLAVGSTTGLFVIFDRRLPTYDRAGLALDCNVLVDLSFHPFLSNALLFVLDVKLLLYFTDVKALIPICPASDLHDDFLGACCPDPVREHAILLIFRSHALFYRTNTEEAPQHIKYLHANTSKLDQARAYACFGGKLYVRGCDDSLQLFELIGGTFCAVRIARALRTKSLHFYPVDSTVFFGSSKGILARSGQVGDLNHPVVDRYWDLGDGIISNILGISDELIVIPAPHSYESPHAIGPPGSEAISRENLRVVTPLRRLHLARVSVGSDRLLAPRDLPTRGRRCVVR
jgi:hypothetical protein